MYSMEVSIAVTEIHLQYYTFPIGTGVSSKTDTYMAMQVCV